MVKNRKNRKYFFFGRNVEISGKNLYRLHKKVNEIFDGQVMGMWRMVDKMSKLNLLLWGGNQNNVVYNVEKHKIEGVEMGMIHGWGK